MKKLSLILSLILCLFACTFVACNKEVEMQSGSVNYTLSVNISEVTLEKGETARIVAVCGEENVVFSSKNADVATVSNEGIVTAVKEGTTYVTITAGEQSKLCKISVVAYEYAVSLDETNIITVVGALKKIAAAYTCEGEPIVGDISWSATNAEKCTLTEMENGVVFKAQEKGIYTLTATANKAEAAICVIKVMAADASILATPSVVLNGEEVTWTAVENATAYLVKADDGEWTRITDLRYTTTGADVIYVRAIADDSCDYYDSEIVSVSVK